MPAAHRGLALTSSVTTPPACPGLPAPPAGYPDALTPCQRAAVRFAPPPRSAAAKEITAAATEHAAELIHDVFHGHTSGTTAEASALLKRTLAHLVITRFLLRIAEYIVCFRSFFELLFSSFIIWILIRMVLHGLLAVGLIYFVFVGTLVFTKYLVIISLRLAWFTYKLINDY